MFVPEQVTTIFGHKSMSEAKKERVVPVRHPIYGMCVVLGVAVLILAIVEGVY